MNNKDEVRKTGKHKSTHRSGRFLALLLALMMAVSSPLMSIASYAEGEPATSEQQTVQTAEPEEAAPVKEEPDADSNTAVKEEKQQPDVKTDKPAAEKEDSKPAEDKAEAKEDQEEKNPWADLMSVEELGKLPVDVADATIEYKGKDAPAVNDRGWAANIYYTHQADVHSVSFSEDFSLKYQLIFESSKDYAANTVELRVPLSLVKTKDGEEIAPDAIGVPRMTEGKTKESDKTFFNYEIDTKNHEIVFFNYTKIPAGTISAWQVSYQDIDVSEVEEEASWSFVPEVTVKNDGKKEHLKENELMPVEGTVLNKEEAKAETEDADEKNDDQTAEDITPVETQDAGEDMETVSDLKNNPDDEAGAIKGAKKEASLMAKAGEQLREAGSRHGEYWTYNIYYVNEASPNYVSKTNDFKLKYQMEFNNSVNIAAGDAVIRMPANMIQYGHPPAEAKSILEPSELGIPKGTPDEPVVTRKSSFNYYIETDEEGNEYYVFFNYEKLDANSKNAWQILYKNVNVMEIEDGYSWSVEPKVTVQVPKEEGGTEEQTLDVGEISPLAGQVNTQAELLTYSKTPYQAPGKSYTPELYTQKQVRAYAPNLDSTKIPGGDEKLIDHFDEYYYMVWKIEVRGYATQPWNLNLLDTTWQDNRSWADTSNVPNSKGFIVGFTSGGSTVSGETDPSTPYKTDYRVASFSKSRTINGSYYVVTAFPKSYVTPNYTWLHNRVDVTLDPYDPLDSSQTGYSSYSWQYRNYEWHYRGDTIGVNKTGGSTLNGWLTVDENLPDDESLAASSFSVGGTCYGYGFTHYLYDGTGIDGSSNVKMGDYVPGNYAKITTTDDFVYAYPQGVQNDETVRDYYVLGKEDYFFKQVSVSISDKGYDVYEDEQSSPIPVSETENLPEYAGIDRIDRDLHVYAMFGDNEDDEWEEVAVVPWKTSGQLSYTFTAAQIARQPWRVKIEHNAVDYLMTSNISTSISIKGSSPAFKEFREKALQVKLENIGGIAGEVSYSYGNGQRGSSYFHDQRVEGGNYSEPELEQRTRDLWNMIIMRDNAFGLLKRESRSAHAGKTGSIRNDQENSRVRIRYRMEASEGYLLYSESAVPYLKQDGKNTPSPDREEVVFYDLLPFGVQFDPSGTVRAGRLSQPSDPTRTLEVQSESSWDKSQVSISVDPQKDIVQNYKGTGRTLVRFHVIYSGRDSTKYNNGQWYSGFGVAFDAYCEYENYKEAGEQPNIVAYIPAGTDEDGNPVDIIGTENQVSKDDGVVVSSDGFKEYYKPLGSDINEDGITASRNVLYAQSNVFSDIAMATQDSATKTVRGEHDPFGVYKRSTVVTPGEQYEYKITVTNMNPAQSIKDLYIFDRLENSIPDRVGKEGDFFDDSRTEDGYDIWLGTFVGVSTGELEALGIEPVVYYNARRDAKQPEYQNPDHPSTILTEENGWIKASDWTGSLSDVKAIAIDAHRMKNKDYELPAQDSISVSVYMKAPDEMPETAVWTYNYPSFYSLDMGTDAAGFTSGNSSKLKIAEAKRLELEKELSDDTPSARQNDRFRFYLTWKDGNQEAVFSYKEYDLYEKNSAGDWVLQSGLHATDAAGSLYLGRRQKAVFEGVDAEKIEIREEDSMRWKLDDPDLGGTTNEDGTRYVLAMNHYKPIIYVKKNVEGYPADQRTRINETPFKMRLTDASGNPVADRELFLVKKALTNGEEPELVPDAAHRLYGTLETPEVIPEGVRTLKTDADGVFDIYPGEIVAFRLDEMNVNFTITELPAYYADDSDWNCKTPEVTKKVTEKGAVFELTNSYKWKDLKITKSVTGIDSSKVADTEFTFKIYKANEDGTKGEQIKDFEWRLMGESTEEEEIWNRPAEDGSVKAACAGKTIYIRNDPNNRQFKAGLKVIVEEILEGDLGDYYNNTSGDVAVTIPVYASAGEAAFVNKWMYRDLDVSKSVVKSDPEEVLTKSFTMVLEMAAPAEEGSEPVYAPAAEKEYTLYDAAGNRIYNYESGQTTEKDETKTEIPLKTNTSGEFALADGQTAHFDSLATDGTLWRARERADEEYPPITPVISEDDPTYTEYLEGVLGRDGSAQFVNGKDGFIVVRKNWIGDDKKAEAYINNPYAQIYNNMTVAKFDISAPVQVLAYNNATYREDVQQYDPITGQYVRGNYISFNGPDAYIIFKVITSTPDGGTYVFGETEYTLTEINPQTMIADSSSMVTQFYQVNPDTEEVSINTTAGETPEAVLENHLSTVSSMVQKRVEGGDVPPDSTLVWRVEKYEGGEWVPAKDVRYSIYSATYRVGYSYFESPVETKSGKTGDDGLLSMTTIDTFYEHKTRTENNYGSYYTYTTGSMAFAMFDRDVKVNLYSGMKEGDYRVVEVPEESDSEWGTPCGYTVTPILSSDGHYPYGYWEKAMSPDPDAATGFVNSMKKEHITIEKVVDEPTDQVFTFTLEQYKDPRSNDVLVPGANLPYTVYDKATKEVIRTGVTTAAGKLTLQGGQYAEIEVPPSTRWRATEDDAWPYYVREIGTENRWWVKDKMTLNQVANESPDKEYAFTITKIADSDGNEVNEPGAGLPYTVYDSEGNELRTGVTDEGGHLTLNGGETAIVTTPEKARWTVSRTLVTNGSSADMTLTDGPESYEHSDMIRRDFGDAVRQLYTKTGNTAPLTKVVFGKKSDYSDKATGESIVMDSKYVGTIKGYLHKEGGECTLYVLSDDLMYTNTNSANMFNDSVFYSVQEIDFDNVSTEKTKNMNSMFNNCYSLTTLNGEESFDTSKVTDMSNMFSNCSSIKKIDLDSWDTGNVNYMAYMFAGANLTGMNAVNLDTGNVINMSYMFAGVDLTGISSLTFDTGKVIDMSYMFSSAQFNEMDLSGFDVSKAANVQNMFYYSKSNKLNLSGWKFESTNSLNSMFYSSRFEQLDIDGWDISRINTMNNMFASAVFDQLDLSNWNMTNVTSTQYMFNRSKFNKLTLDNWDMRNTSAYRMFTYSGKDTSSSSETTGEVINLNNWQVNGSTYISDFWRESDYTYSTYETVNMNNWNLVGTPSSWTNAINGVNCNTLNANDWLLPNVSSLYYSFTSVRAKNLNLKNWSVPNLTTVERVFNNCRVAEVIDMSGWQLGRLTNISYMFADNSTNLSTLRTVDMTGWDLSRVSNATGMCQNAANLTTLYCDYDLSQSSVLSTSYANNMFYNSGLPWHESGNGKDYAKPGSNFSTH